MTAQKETPTGKVGAQVLHTATICADYTVAQKIGNEIGWAFGLNQTDNRPTNYAGTWEDLLEFIDQNRAPRKGLNYICPRMKRTEPRQRPRRCNANAEPRIWMAWDMDGNISGNAFAALLGRLSELGKGVAYETASSAPEAHRCRFIFLLSRPVTGEEAKRIGEAVQNESGVTGWDSSTHRPCQPVFLPPFGVALYRFEGQLLDVDYWLSKTPPPKSKPKHRYISTQTRAKTNVFGLFANAGMVLSVGADKHGVICPWHAQHTDGRPEAALFEPSATNNGAWGFKCLHAHCKDRTIKDVYALIDSCKLGVQL